MVDIAAARALAERLNNDVNLFSPLDWQDHVALAHEAAATILAMAEELEWQTIETLPEGEHVELWFPKGEKGIGGVECATVYKSDDRWSFWTHGGPNAGIDWDPRDDEKPTHWRRLPPAPHHK